MFQYFYNETLRKITLAFGGLFDEIYVSKKTSSGTVERTRVPLTYSGKEKFVRRLTEASSISSGVKIETLLPKLAFEMNSLQYDTSRKVNKINQKAKSTSTNYYTGYAEVPYNIKFGLYAFTRNVDDNLQIIEQIIPYFSPEFVVTLKLNNLDTNVDVPIILNSVNFIDSSEGSLLDRRTVISTMDFSAKAYIYGRIKETSSGIIKEADVNIFEGDACE